MKSLSKTAKTVDDIRSAALALCLVAEAVLLFSFIVIAFAGETFFQGENGIAELTLGIVELEMTEGYFSASQMMTQFLITFGIGAVYLGFFAFFLKFTKKILAPLIAQTPFDGSISLNLKKLSLITLIGGGVNSILSFAGDAYILKCFDIEKLFNNSVVAKYTVNNDIDMTFLLIAAIIYMLSIVFRYGEELQKESDETL